MRVLRRIAAALIGIAFAGSLLVLPTQPAHASEPDPLIDASNHLFECIQTARTVSVLFVMDRSGSLEKGRNPTDVDGVRFEGMRSALTGLAKLQRPDGAKLRVEAAASAFNHNYYDVSQIVDWTTINGDNSSASIDRLVERTRRRATSTGGTDFEKALKGGFRDFTSRKDRNNCKIMLWFTDGVFDDARGKSNESGTQEAKDAIEAARREMCTPRTGIVDRIRAAGIVLLGLQLGEQRADLRRMSVGTLDDKSCGTFPVAEGEAPGGYLQARDTDELAWVFSRMGDLAQGCTPTGELGGQVDPGLARMVVRVQRPELVTSPPERERLVLTRTPVGPELEAFAPGESTINGYSVLADRDSTQVSALVTFADTAGGHWSINPGFTTSPDREAYCVFADLSLVREPSPTLPVAGKVSELRHSLQGPTAMADLSVYRDVEIKATVTAGDGTSLPATTTAASDGTVVVGFTPGLSDARLDVRVTANVTTASGLVLPKLVLEYATGVSSDALPSIIPGDQLDLGTAMRTDPTSAELELVGAELGDSQICLGAPRIDQESSPGGALGYPQQCFELSAGERTSVTVTFTPGAEVVSDGRGAIPIEFVGAALEGQTRSEAGFELPVVWRQDIPVNQLVLYGIPAIALALTFALVWLALCIANWAVARFDTKDLRYGRVETWLTPGGLRRVERAGQGPLYTAEDLRAVPRSQRRTIRLGEVTLRARASIWEPLRGPRFSAEPSAGHRIHSSSGLSNPEATWAPVPPSLDSVVLLVAADGHVSDTDQEPIRTTLYVVANGDHLPDVQEQGISWSSVAKHWREALARSAAPKTTSATRRGRRTRSTKQGERP